jgi:hypothetical protein
MRNKFTSNLYGFQQVIIPGELEARASVELEAYAVHL